MGMGRGGCSGKLFLIVIAVIAFFVLGGKNLLFGGGDNNSNNVTNLTTTTSQTSSQSSGSGSGSSQSSGSGSSQSGSSIMNLLSSFLGSTDSGSAYDFEGTLTGLTGGSGSSGSAQYFTTSMENNTATADTSVASGTRDKYTTIKGKTRTR